MTTQPPTRTHTLGFIGAGNMAEAIARAAIEQGVLTPADIVAVDVNEARRDVFRKMKITVVDDVAQVIAASQQIMLAVKPQQAADVAGVIAPELGDDQVVISILAGITTVKLGQLLNAKRPRLIRVMPNTPVMVGLGMTGVATGPHAKPGDEQLSMTLFSCGGSEALLVTEDKIDAITAVSGSGPAYLFYLAEAMQQAAEELGLGEQKELLVNQTLIGAATLLLNSPDSAAELRKKVSSPGGTTQAAIESMESQHVRAAIAAGVAAAEQRSKELGN